MLAECVARTMLNLISWY